MDASSCQEIGWPGAEEGASRAEYDVDYRRAYSHYSYQIHFHGLLSCFMLCASGRQYESSGGAGCDRQTNGIPTVSPIRLSISHSPVSVTRTTDRRIGEKLFHSSVRLIDYEGSIDRQTNGKKLIR